MISRKWIYSLAAVLMFAAAHVSAQSIKDLDVRQLQDRMQDGRLSSVAITQEYLQRIESLDRNGPALNSVIEINSRALDEARERDEERRSGKIRGPLHGIPVLIKDNIDAMPMVNSAGSLALAENKPANDASLVMRLRDAGAVILGKTNLSEWANFRSTRSISGWSSRGGQTRNAYVLDRNPCGSSSGTGTAIAASLASVGIGTETDGSIICPSAVNGLVGIKPTVGLVSRSGVIPIAESQDTPGPMARSVSDAWAVLQVIAGKDATDKATGKIPATLFDGLSKPLDANALKGKRIGAIKNSGSYHPDVRAAYMRALDDMRAQGATIVEVEIGTDGQWNDPEYQVLLYEFKDGLERYLRDAKAPYSTLKELIEFNRRNQATVMPLFAQEIMEQAAAKGALSEKKYLQAKQKARELTKDKGLYATLDKHKLDALTAASMSPAWLTDPVNADHFTGAGYSLAAVAGTPSINVPMGFSHGLPLGITFMSKAWQEPMLINIAYSYEQATRHHREPQYLPTIAAGNNTADLRVVTLNLYHDKAEWPTRLPQIISTLRELQPDAIALQEVIQTDATPNQAEAIAQAIGYHSYFVSTDPAGQVKRYGNAILTRMPMTAMAETKLKPLNDSRTVAFVRFNKDGRPYAMFATHLNYENNENGQRIRREQTQDLAQFIAQHRGTDTVIVAGDFNTVSNAPELSAITTEYRSGYDQSIPQANLNEREHTTLNPKYFSELRDLRRIDHIFADTKRLKATHAQRLFTAPDTNGVYATDHFGVLVDFKLAPRSP